MRTLILFVLLAPIIVIGQNIGVGSYPVVDNVFFADSSYHHSHIRPQYDTIPEEVGIMWEKNTLVTRSVYNYYDVSFMFGYELINIHIYYTDDLIAGYLDDEKKPLSKSIVVWQSKRR